MRAPHPHRSRARAGSAAVELAFIIPVLLALTCGVIDFGRLLFAWNAIQKAAQVGAQAAIIRDPIMLPVKDWFRCQIANGAISAGSVGTTCTFTDPGTGAISVRGDCNFGTVVCTSTGCSRNGGTATALATGAAAVARRTTFEQIVAAMRVYYPYLQDTNVRITYRPSLLGFVGRPVPVVELTVDVINAPFQFLLLPVATRAGTASFTGDPFALNGQSLTMSSEDLSDNTCREQDYTTDPNGNCTTTRADTAPAAPVCFP